MADLFSLFPPSVLFPYFSLPPSCLTHSPTHSSSASSSSFFSSVNPSLSPLIRGFVANCPRFAILAIFNPDLQFQLQIIQVSVRSSPSGITCGETREKMCSWQHHTLSHLRKTVAEYRPCFSPTWFKAPFLAFL